MVNKTVTDLNNYMREVCVHSVEKKSSRKVAGVGMNVEIDESSFTKHKNNTWLIYNIFLENMLVSLIYPTKWGLSQ